MPDRGRCLDVGRPCPDRAQATPDLSGCGRSTQPKRLGLSPRLSRPARSDGVALEANQILISQTPTELTLAQGTRAAVYKLDGTENWSPSLKSTARWTTPGWSSPETRGLL